MPMGVFIFLLLYLFAFPRNFVADESKGLRAMWVSVLAAAVTPSLPTCYPSDIPQALYTDGLEWAEAPQLTLDQNWGPSFFFWGWETCGNNLNPCMRLVLRGQSPSPGWDETEEHCRLVYCQCFKSIFFITETHQVAHTVAGI